MNLPLLDSVDDKPALASDYPFFGLQKYESPTFFSKELRRGGGQLPLFPDWPDHAVSRMLLRKSNYCIKFP